MAITKCLYINSKKTSGSGGTNIHLKNALDYILNQKKTSMHNLTNKHLEELTSYIMQDYKISSNTHYISSVNCPVTTAYEEMLKTKEHYGKTSGRAAYHYIISFKPNEIDEATAWKITNDFVSQFLNNEYECVFALHTDKEHIHSHIVFNSVNFITGKKFRSPFGDWANRIQPLVDKLCIENNIAPLEYHIDEYKNEKGETVVHYEYSKNFNFSQKIKMDIDEAIAQSDTFEEFCNFLKKEKNYRIKFGKYMALSLPDMKKFRRLKTSTIGTDYTMEMIKERIAFKNGNYALPPINKIPTVTKIYFKTEKPKYIKYKEMNYIEKAAIRRMLRLKKLKERIGYSNSYLYNQQKKKLKQAIQNYNFILHNKITSQNDIKEILTENQALKSKLFSDYKKNQCRHKYPEELMKIYEEIKNLQIYYDLYTKYNDNDYINEFNKYNELINKLSQSDVTQYDIDNYLAILDNNDNIIKNQLKYVNENIYICKRLINNSTVINKKSKNINIQSNNTTTDENIKNITINIRLIVKSDANYVYTRVPKTYGDNIKILRINKDELNIIDDEQTIVTQLDMKKDYSLYNKDFKEDSNCSGEKLYSYYDEVNRNVSKNKNKNQIKL